MLKPSQNLEALAAQCCSGKEICDIFGTNIMAAKVGNLHRTLKHLHRFGRGGKEICGIFGNNIVVTKGETFTEKREHP